MSSKTLGALRKVQYRGGKQRSSVYVRTMLLRVNGVAKHPLIIYLPAFSAVMGNDDYCWSSS
jgi:hypothetical protein